MAPGFDRGMSSLLCPEDSISIMGFDDDAGVVKGVGDEGEGELCLGYGFEEVIARAPLLTDECVALLVGKEGEHLAKDGYVESLRSGLLDLSDRRDAVDWIVKVHAYYGFGPLSAYLSINYLDRFLSTYELPQGKSWMMQLLSVACLSLGAKMEETHAPPVLDLQAGDAKYVFESKTIQRMELLVLSTLSWRMWAITPFSYIDYFIHRMNDGNPPSRKMMARSLEIILCTIKGVEFLEFKPSEIAAAVAMFLVQETCSISFNNSTAHLVHVNEERALICLELIQDLALTPQSVKCAGGPPFFPAPQSPIGVLDVACLSSKSDETATGSCVSSYLAPSPKRRKVNKSSDVSL